MTEQELRTRLNNLTGEIPAETHRAFLSAVSPGKEEVVMKKKISIGLIIAILLSLAALAYSANGIVWFSLDGKQVDYSEKYTSDDNSGWISEKKERMYSLLNSVPDDYYAVVTWKGGKTVQSRKKKKAVTALDQMMDKLDNAGYAHPDAIVPKGYTFVDCELTYDCRQDKSYSLVSKTEDDDFILEQYSIEPGDEVLTGYTVRLKRGKSLYFCTISSKLITSENVPAFGFTPTLDDEIKADAVQVSGMEEALLIQHSEGLSILAMRRRLDQPVTVRTEPQTVGSDQAESQQAITTYCYEYINITILDKKFPEAFLSVF